MVDVALARDAPDHDGGLVDRRLMVLGLVRILVPEREVVLHGAQPQKLLVRLVLTGDQPVSAGDLAEMLWPVQRVAHWDGALRSVVTKVRSFLRVLGRDDARVVSLGHSYRFESAGTFTIDARFAESELARSSELLAQDDVHGAADAAGRAAVLLRGSLLPGLDGEWVDRRREELERLRHRALRQAASAASSCHRFDDAISFASEAVAEDSLDEESHRLLMLAHAAAGNRASALRAYERCRLTLSDELGIEPSGATRALYEKLYDAR